jgi:hypothetical protein
MRFVPGLGEPCLSQVVCSQIRPARVAREVITAALLASVLEDFSVMASATLRCMKGESGHASALSYKMWLTVWRLVTSRICYPAFP